MAEVITIQVDITIQSPHESMPMGTVHQLVIETLSARLKTLFGDSATISGRVTIAKE
jgi:hypothetical protein